VGKWALRKTENNPQTAIRKDKDKDKKQKVLLGL
jgi:hypothetical protein